MLAECSSSVMHPMLNGFVMKKPLNEKSLTAIVALEMTLQNVSARFICKTA